jgi:hypothetical protein
VGREDGAGLQWDAVPPVLRMGKYVIDGLLGPGGVTETYLAHVEADGKPSTTVELCALKLLRADRVPDASFARVAARFLSAGRQLRDFHRPGFCRVIDISDNPSATFIVSEYAPGCDLGRLLEACQAEGKPGVHPVLVGLVGSEIARLLHVGHSAKPAFCHLGLSPQNVIVAASGEVMLLDGGISASLRAITEQPSERWALVAPELQGVDVGVPAACDRAMMAADLYSLGALLLLLLTGRTASATSGNGGTPEVPDVPGMTGKFAAALRRLLSRDPNDRPEEAAMLVEWLAGETVQVRERRRLIAEGVRAAERGVRMSSQSLPALTSHPPGQAGGTSPPEQGVAPTGRSTRAAGPLRTLRVAALLLAALACAAAALVGLGWRQREATRGDPTRTGAVSHRPQDVEMPQRAPQAGRGTGKDLAVQAPAAPQSSGHLMARVAGHLVVETVPPGAMVWVDGVLRGKTFADILVGDGGHRVVVIAPGHRMFRDVIDTSAGTIIRRTLAEIAPPIRGNGFLDVDCGTVGRFPILLDDEETGLLCPAKMLPTTSGKHTVGIFVPQERRTFSVVTAVGVGSKPTKVDFSQ